MTIPIELTVGRDTWPVTVRDGTLIKFRRSEPAVPATVGPRELLAAALNKPLGLEEPLRRALTPDDRIVVVVDERLPHLAELITELIDHVGAAGIEPEAVTLVVPPGGGSGPWVEALPDEIADIRLESHDPEDPQKLAYLATTKAGRRIYLNRAVVEADYVIVLAGRGFDPFLGHAGAAGAIFPVLGDGETRAGYVGQFTTKPPRKLSPLAVEGNEIAWLIGTPLFIQVIEGPGNTLAEIVAGLPDSAPDGVARQDARWRGTVPDRPDLVVAAVSGDPGRTGFAELAAAAAAAARVVQTDGRIALLTTASPTLDEGAEIIRQAEDPSEAERRMKKRKPDDWPAAQLWSFAARTARLFVASGWPEDVTDELFAVPLASAAELQRLIDAAESVLILPDAQKVMVELE